MPRKPEPRKGVQKRPRPATRKGGKAAGKLPAAKPAARDPRQRRDKPAKAAASVPNGGNGPGHHPVVDAPASVIKLITAPTPGDRPNFRGLSTSPSDGRDENGTVPFGPPATGPSAQPPGGGNLIARYRPQKLADIRGQADVIEALQAFVAAPASAAFIFAGPSGVGKTATAHALANELGCDGEWGGLTEIPSGTQDGKAVDALLRSLRLTPMAGSGWKVAIINEADRMTDQAEAIWLDGIEKLPAKSVVIFTTNNLARMTPRLIRRCEVHQFDAMSEKFKAELAKLVADVWQRETGSPLAAMPAGLGKFELADEAYSIGLALQQIAPYVRTGKQLPAEFSPPIVRGSAGRPKPVTEAPAADTKSAQAGSGDTVVAEVKRGWRCICPACRRWIQRGELIRELPGGGQRKRWQHAAC